MYMHATTEYLSGYTAPLKMSEVSQDDLFSDNTYLTNPVSRAIDTTDYPGDSNLLLHPDPDSQDSSSISVQVEDEEDLTPFWRMGILFWTLGLITNFGYVIVFSAIKSIVEDFDMQQFAGVLQWANVAFGIGAKIINIVFLLEVSFAKRVFVNFAIMACGGVITMFSMKISFYMAVVGIILIGTSSAFGESIMLGYFKRFDPKVAGAWSSGTGGAGVFGSLSFVLLKSVLKLDNFTIFSILFPLSIIYYAAFLKIYFSYDTVARKEREKARLEKQDSFPNHSINTMNKSISSIGAPSTLRSRIGGDNDSPKAPQSLFADQSSNADSFDHGNDGYTPMSYHQSAINDLSLTNANLGGMKVLPSAPSTPVHEARKSDKRRKNGNQKQNKADSSHFQYDSSQGGYLGGSDETADDDDLGLDSIDGDGADIEPIDFRLNYEDTQEGQGEAVTSSLLAHEGDVAKYEDSLDLDDPAYRSTLGACARVKLMLPVVFPVAFQLYLVYFFEYSAYVTFALKANPGKDQSTDFLEKNAFELLSMCYQLGVLISRSSIELIQIENFSILTIGQGLNFLLWGAQALYHFMPLYVQFASMIWIGLFAGLMYVNVFHSLLKNPRLSPDRELGVNIVSVFVTLGIVTSSLFSILALNTFLKDV